MAKPTIADHWKLQGQLSSSQLARIVNLDRRNPDLVWWVYEQVSGHNHDDSLPPPKPSPEMREAAAAPINEMVDAAALLLEQWDDELHQDGYPDCFESLEEVLHQLMEWRDTVRGR